MGILLLWEIPKIKNYPKLKLFPVPLLVVGVGALMNQLFILVGGSFAEMTFLEPTHLIDLPDGLSDGNYKDLLVTPDFSFFANKNVYIHAITLALVGSIASLLCLEATDKLDPEKNITPTNRELKAQGIGNFISGLLGGLPVAMVIIRSSANINAHAKTKLSSFYHGLFFDC